MPVDSTMGPEGAIAIVGIGGLFPGADTLEQFWANVRECVDATSDVPPARWLIDPAQAFDPRVALLDHVYSMRGGFVARPRLDPAGFDLDGSLLDRLDPLFHLALYAAREAWRDARMIDVDRRRVGVIFGNIVLPTETASALSRELLYRVFEEELGVPSADLGPAEPLNAFPAGLPAAVVARALGLKGAAYTIDAACGSSLYALKLAIDELRSGRADAMLSGGVSCPDPLYTQMGFSQLRALSARGRAAPFDHTADGLVVGEGAGMFVLKRLEDALRHGDHVYGVVAGIGLSNDVEGDLLAPSTSGQLRAMRMAYEQAGWSPADVDLIECHATGTPKGDLVEVESLKSLWGGAGWRRHCCVVGSVKSNIGHALTAAGAAGLIKVLLALENGILPPTVNFERSAPSLGLEDSPFRVLTRAEPWPARAAGLPRRAAVSGFGFGGINAHVLIEEWVPAPAADQGGPGQGRRAGGVRAAAAGRTASIAIVGMSAHFGPFAGKNLFQQRVLGSDETITAAGPRSWWGLPELLWYRRQGWDERSFQGYYIDSLELRVDQFRIPPKELAEMLPQQSLMLRVAAESILDARWDRSLGLRTGVLIGIGLDSSATNYHLRWSLPGRAREWNRTLGLGLSLPELDRWVEELRRAAGPALTANRTMGSLGGLIASRIAREFGVGGPSFTVSCDETSGIQALAIATHWLGRGELDAAIVGAVDFAGDVRAVLARHRLEAGSSVPSGPGSSLDAGGDDALPCSCDGAVALVLKRLEDAERDRDRIYAVIRGAGTSSPAWESSPPADRGTPGWPGFLDVAWSGCSGPAEIEADASALAGLCPPASHHAACGLGSIVGDLGHAGAAMGLASVAKAALCLDQQIIPGARQGARRLRQIASLPLSVFVPSGSQYWLRNRAEGPRRAAVSAAGLGGARQFVVLEEFEDEPAEVPQVLDRSDQALERAQPLGPRRLAVFALEADDEPGLIGRMEELRELARGWCDGHVEALARAWWLRHPNNPRLRLGLALVADGAGTLLDLLSEAERQVRGVLPDDDTERGEVIRVYRRESLPSAPNRLAFVYPGLGSHFEGMGRALSTLWPDVLRAQDSRTGYLRDQLDPAVWWSGDLPRSFAGHRVPILGNVAAGSLVTDLLRDLGLAPDAAIGYSLGESAALVALGAWPARDLMLRRLQSSALFHSDLAGPCDAARRVWGIPPGEPVDWIAGIVPRSLQAVRGAISGKSRVYALIKNTADETVVGGFRPAVAEVVASLQCPFIELSTVSTVHCEIGRAVEAEYRSLHDLETIAPAGIAFYSGAWGRPYALDRRSAADAMTAQSQETIDFPAMIEHAYESGIRVFLEVGPGSSCTRLIGRILGRRPHLARAVCRPDRDPLGAIMEALGELIAHRVPVELAGLYGRRSGHYRSPEAAASTSDQARRRTVRVEVCGRSFRAPALPSRPAAPPAGATVEQHGNSPETPVAPGSLTASESPPGNRRTAPEIASEPPSQERSFSDGTGERLPLSRSLYDAERATADAHQAFLRVAHHATALIGRLVEFQLELIETWKQTGASTDQATDARRCGAEANPWLGLPPAPVVLDRTQCLEFAVGSIAAVLGPEYAIVDRFPTRVRLPGEPLMLVDRILAIEGQPRSLQAGRVVTEHAIEPDAWYLDGGKIPACIAIEAGQADLFLCGYLGVDFETRGLAVYRLLDATVTFHRELPSGGEVICYDIRITSFFRQGKTILFRFQFDAMVAGEPLLTMRDGCAGFFSSAELTAGRGILTGSTGGPSQPGPPAGAVDGLVPMSLTDLALHQVEALRQGDLATAFGPPFDRLKLDRPLPLPGARMTLVHRVETLDPTGGSFGLGLIRAQADIHQGDWFMVCHFVDDCVMPGTLMYECCLHALRIFMMRMGWVGRRGQVTFEPVPGIANRLNCRGQIVESTSVATYEVTIKERGYRPEPYAIADALIFADGKPIVAVTDMALQLSGTNRFELEELWAGLVPGAMGQTGVDAADPAVRPEGRGGRVLVDHDRILAFARGRPSDAFGEPYRIFDGGRFIARLPGPPYQFLHRITRIEAEPWRMVAGGSAEAEYDIAADAWFFEADRQDRMPLAVLLEVALQACGWTAAYMGSALTSDDDLKFRNLGGSACQHRVVTRHTGTLTTRIRVNKVSSTAGMILQHYDFAVDSREGRVYDGCAEFGFFHPRSLIQQAGIRDAAPYEFSAAERARAESFAFPDGPCFPGRTWRMIDQVDLLLTDGGPHGLGVVSGSTQVDPDAWFFKAHFMDDPVWPGSLGLESLLQLLKIMAGARWGVGPGSAFESPGLGRAHRWTYRGQIIPANRRVTVQAEIKERDDRRRLLVADGHLEVDGTVIYQMSDFSIRLGDE